MNEFALINSFFKSIQIPRQDVVLGIGDDAACLDVPSGFQLVVSTDTLVAEIHFLSSWDAFDIAYKSVMVNLSDIAAMGGSPAWVSLALTLPELDESWLQRFSEGLNTALQAFNVALIGGDTTRGPLSVTLTVHGFVPKDKAVRRDGASPGDKIYTSGMLGASALAVDNLAQQTIHGQDEVQLMKRLLRPTPRIDLQPVIQQFATAAIDISDGLGADLQHICHASQVGARLQLENIPVHPLVKQYRDENSALELALSGGDDYELCFTIRPQHESLMLKALSNMDSQCFCIGAIESECGIRGQKYQQPVPLTITGYRHF